MISSLPLLLDLLLLNFLCLLRRRRLCRCLSFVNQVCKFDFLLLCTLARYLILSFLVNLLRIEQTPFFVVASLLAGEWVSPTSAQLSLLPLSVL
jgi:hypothetical protein